MRKLETIKTGCSKTLRIVSKVAHKAEHPIHLIYFLAVSLTAHGAYAYVAILCLIVGAGTVLPIASAAAEAVEEEDA